MRIDTKFLGRTGSDQGGQPGVRSLFGGILFFNDKEEKWLRFFVSFMTIP
jgi:hypothetical protein